MLTRIFALHRVKFDLSGRCTPPPDIVLTIEQLESDIQECFKSIEPIVIRNQWKYHRQLSGAIQEYIEAVSFKHFLSTLRIITLAEIQSNISNIMIYHCDYLLGIMDLSGELMRYGISNLADNEEVESLQSSSSLAPRRLSSITQTISETLRCFNSEIAALDMKKVSSIKEYQELPKKIQVFRASLSKLEYAQYSLMVRLRA